jgi:outer membrane protein
MWQVRQSRGGKGLPISLLFQLGAFIVGAQTSTNAPPIAELSLADYTQRVIEYNESVQIRLLELAISNKRVKAERGIFEPEFFSSLERAGNRRENTAQQKVSSSFEPLFSELNSTYSGGIEFQAPTGARLRLGYTLQDLANNYTRKYFNLDRQYQTFAGTSIVQPLLKNGWGMATLANIRVAALESDIAFQDYRRQMMVVLSTAEAAYWDVYLTQEQLRLNQESVTLADTILADVRISFEVGKSNELDVVQAEAGLALRKSKRSEAEQKRYEAINRLTAFYSGAVVSTNASIKAVTAPETTETDLNYFDAWGEAFETNPDYLIQRKKVIEEDVKLAYSRNQRWPQLDVKASYGLNGLGNTPAASMDDIESAAFSSWSIGMEFRIPLAGGIKGRNELAAAKLRKQQAILSLKDVEVQIANALDTSIHKVRSAHENVTNYQTVVALNQNLLDTQLARLQVGKSDTRRVLEIERDLFEAKTAALESLIQYQKAKLELELVKGSTLKRRALDLTRRELEERTEAVVRRTVTGEAEYAGLLAGMKKAYEIQKPTLDERNLDDTWRLLRARIKEEEDKALQAEQKVRENQEKALKVLREKLNEMEKEGTLNP